MNSIVRKALTLILALMFLGSVGMVISRAIQYREGDETYDEAKELVSLPDFTDLSPLPVPDGSSAPDTAPEHKPVYVDPYADALRSMDFTALQEVNQDVLGWILIPGTRVSYPVVQGEDNSYYLNHTWRKGRNSVGAIFMECLSSRDLSDFNTIIYGHRMNNRSMFGVLSNYSNQDFWKEHPYVYLTDESGSHRYEVFSAYEASIDALTYRIGFPGDEDMQAFLDFCCDQSVIQTGVTPTVYDRVITLSTCTGRGHATRWVVQAVLKGTAPTEPTEPSQPEQTEQQPESPDQPDSPASQDLQVPEDGSAAKLPEKTDPAGGDLLTPEDNSSAGTTAVPPADPHMEESSSQYDPGSTSAAP